MTELPDHLGREASFGTMTCSLEVGDILCVEPVPTAKRLVDA